MNGAGLFSCQEFRGFLRLKFRGVDFFVFVRECGFDFGERLWNELNHAVDRRVGLRGQQANLIRSGNEKADRLNGYACAGAAGKRKRLLFVARAGRKGVFAAAGNESKAHARNRNDGVATGGGEANGDS